MTYIIGWKNETSVFLSGDIAITRNVKLKNASTITIFGDIAINHEKQSVNEECLKLFRINDKTIASFAGDLASALSFIEKLKMYISIDEPLEMLEFIAKHEERTIEKYSVFIGLIDNDEKPRLFSFNLHDQNELLEHNVLVQDGSANQRIRNYTDDICKEVSVLKNLNDDEILSLVNIFHQNVIIQEVLQNQGIGGIFWGLRLDKNQIAWQKDTAIIMFEFKNDPKIGEKNISNNPEEIFEQTGIVCITGRDDAVRYMTPYKEEGYRREMVYNCLDTPRSSAEFSKKKEMIIEWHKKWNEETSKIFNMGEAKYYGFIAKKTGLKPRICVFSKEQLNKNGVFIVRTANDAFEIICENGDVGSFISSLRPIDDSSDLEYFIHYLM